MRISRKILIISLLLIPFVTSAEQSYKGLTSSGQMVTIPSPNQNLLSNPFPVYTDGNVVVNHPAPGFSKVNIPVVNSNKKNPGCYIMCYSHQEGLYKVSKTIYAQGMIRVTGEYNNNRMCQPTDAGNKDISVMQQYKDLCNNNIKSCQGNCWAGGDTGGWYGMQQY